MYEKTIYVYEKTRYLEGNLFKIELFAIVKRFVFLNIKP